MPEDIPFSDEKENEVGDDDRDCQLHLGSTSGAEKKDASDLRMNQLFEWEHHAPPFGDGALLVSFLCNFCNDVHISFIYSCLIIAFLIQTLGLRHASELLAFMFVSPPATVSSA